MWVFPEIILQKVIQRGIQGLRNDRGAFEDLFSMYVTDELTPDYGQTYIDQLWDWYTTTKIPVVQAWSLNAQRIPCYSVHLTTETEDESKAAIGDIGAIGDDGLIGTGAMTVTIDIGIHANKAGDHVLWMYYILSYILFKHKMELHRLGLRLTTFSAAEYQKEGQYMGENIWTRWIRIKATTENWWAQTPARTFDEVNTDFAVGLPLPDEISATPDVDLCELNPTVNMGFREDPEDT